MLCQNESQAKESYVTINYRAHAYAGIVHDRSNMYVLIWVEYETIS